MNIDETGDGIALGVKVKPGARRAGIAGTHGDSLAIEVKSPPEGGKANREVLRILSEALGVDVGNLRISAGETSRRKRIRISGLNRLEFEKKIRHIVGS